MTTNTQDQRSVVALGLQERDESLFSVAVLGEFDSKKDYRPPSLTASLERHVGNFQNSLKQSSQSARTFFLMLGGCARPALPGPFPDLVWTWLVTAAERRNVKDKNAAEKTGEKVEVVIFGRRRK